MKRDVRVKHRSRSAIAQSRVGAILQIACPSRLRTICFGFLSETVSLGCRVIVDEHVRAECSAVDGSSNTSSRLQSPVACTQRYGPSWKDTSRSLLYTGLRNMHVTSRSRGHNLKHLGFQLQVALLSVVVHENQRLHAMPCKTFVTVQVKPKRDPNLKGHVPFFVNQHSKRLRFAQDDRPKNEREKKNTFWIPRGNLCTP